jgi:hypothetical protein
MSFNKSQLTQLDQTLTLNKFKRLIKVAIDKNEQSSDKLHSDITFAYSNIQYRDAYTRLSTQNPDNMKA